jgi:hypothetical protein
MSHDVETTLESVPHQSFEPITALAASERHPKGVPSSTCADGRNFGEGSLS